MSFDVPDQTDHFDDPAELKSGSSDLVGFPFGRPCQAQLKDRRQFNTSGTSLRQFVPMCMQPVPANLISVGLPFRLESNGWDPVSMVKVVGEKSIASPLRK